jgi:ribosomal protein S27E
MLITYRINNKMLQKDKMTINSNSAIDISIALSLFFMGLRCPECKQFLFQKKVVFAAAETVLR